MEHTKKLVLVDPRFARPTMKDKALSGLDNEISSILNSDVSDEAKVHNYIFALSRFKAISSPRGPPPLQPPPPPQGPQPQAVAPTLQMQPQAASVAYKTAKPPKRLHKCAKPKLPAIDDSSFWQRKLRTPSKNLSTQWVDDTPTKRKRKQTGLGYKNGILYRPFSRWEL